MFSRVFLAVTGRESVFPQRTAYMACHFSASGTGLSNLPQALPEGSILLLDDSMQVEGHDSRLVVQQLNNLVDKFSVQAVVLDFQRPPTEQSRKMVSAILENCGYEVAVTPEYATGDSVVFLPPPPVNKSLTEHIKPWGKAFLELAMEGLEITVTKGGSRVLPIYLDAPLPLKDKKLHCHYSVKVFPGKAVFTLCRTREDLADLAKEAEEFGVLGTIGLYQELQ